jgi:hypothetical protein
LFPRPHYWYSQSAANRGRHCFGEREREREILCPREHGQHREKGTAPALVLPQSQRTTYAPGRRRAEVAGLLRDGLHDFIMLILQCVVILVKLALSSFVFDELHKLLSMLFLHKEATFGGILHACDHRTARTPHPHRDKQSSAAQQAVKRHNFTPNHFALAHPTGSSENSAADGGHQPRRGVPTFKGSRRQSSQSSGIPLRLKMCIVSKRGSGRGQHTRPPSKASTGTLN